METAWFGYRPLWQLMWAGVFERHPELKVVFTEVHASWVPTIVDMMDVRYEDPWMLCNAAIPRKPSEYWYRQCYVGAAFLSRQEMAMLDLIGRNGVMYGNDYPHIEGIWPHGRHYLHEVLAGQTEEIARLVCSENAARLYRFDLAVLDQHAAEVGPEVDDIIGGEPSPASTHTTDRMAARAARPAGWVMGGPPRSLL
jgi:predicted TIM-barrel fold metal-dependent hydrolase